MEPYRLVHHSRRWYLLVYDVDRGDWRAFRVDRIGPKPPAGPRFEPRELPDDEAAYVVKGVTTRVYRFQARVVLHTSAEGVSRFAWSGFGTITALDDDSCELRTGFESLDALAMYLGMLGRAAMVADRRNWPRMRAAAGRLMRAAGESA